MILCSVDGARHIAENAAVLRHYNITEQAASLLLFTAGDGGALQSMEKSQMRLLKAVCCEQGNWKLWRMLLTWWHMTSTLIVATERWSATGAFVSRTVATRVQLRCVISWSVVFYRYQMQKCLLSQSIIRSTLRGDEKNIVLDYPHMSVANQQIPLHHFAFGVRKLSANESVDEPWRRIDVKAFATVLAYDRVAHNARAIAFRLSI